MGRAVNRQPGYRAGTRRADTQMLIMHTWFNIFLEFPEFFQKYVNIFS